MGGGWGSTGRQYPLLLLSCQHQKPQWYRAFQIPDTGSPPGHPEVTPVSGSIHRSRLCLWRLIWEITLRR